MTEPSARIVADSISTAGHRLTTMEVIFHRFALAEVNTHRVFSRNSASSRAIPVAKQLDRITNDPAIPVKWRLDQPGMQGQETEVADPDEAHDIWARNRVSAVMDATALLHKGLAKGITNRLLEPHMWHTAIITSTAWENFFGLRCNPAADDHIRLVAEAMQRAYNDSEPQKVEDGWWHLPYVDEDERDKYSLRSQVMMSSARCARVSALHHDGVQDPDKDFNLYTKLTSAEPMHASPLEHVATPDANNTQDVTIESVFDSGMYTNITVPVYGNLLGWHSHRYDMEAERGYQSYT